METCSNGTRKATKTEGTGSIDVHTHARALAGHEGRLARRRLRLDLDLDLLRDRRLRLLFDWFDEVCDSGLDAQALAVLACLFAGGRHAVLPECVLAPFADFCDAVHGLDGILDELAVVSYGHVSTLLELVSGVDSHLLARCLAERFRPLDFARIALHLEVFVAF